MRSGEEENQNEGGGNTETKDLSQQQKDGLRRLKKVMKMEKATDEQVRRAIKDFVREEEEDEKERQRSKRTASWSKDDWINFFKPRGRGDDEEQSTIERVKTVGREHLAGSGGMENAAAGEWGDGELLVGSRGCR